MVKKELLEILVCPACKGKLDAAEDSLKCPKCDLVYPIEDGIPVMLVDRGKYEGAAPDKDAGDEIGDN